MNDKPKFLLGLFGENEQIDGIIHFLWNKRKEVVSAR
jgi:hypothetical protein